MPANDKNLDSRRDSMFFALRWNYFQGVPWYFLYSEIKKPLENSGSKH